jgi:hypothetical protein
MGVSPTNRLANNKKPQKLVPLFFGVKKKPNRLKKKERHLRTPFSGHLPDIRRFLLYFFLRPKS